MHLAPLVSIAQTDVNAWLGEVSPGVILAGLFVFGLPTLIASVNGVLAIVKHFKKDPPAHEVYATKSELTSLESRITQQLATAAKNTVDLESRINTQLNQGETLFNSIRAELSHVAERTAELKGVVTMLKEAMASAKRNTRS